MTEQSRRRSRKRRVRDSKGTDIPVVTCAFLSRSGVGGWLRSLIGAAVS